MSVQKAIALAEARPQLRTQRNSVEQVLTSHAEYSGCGESPGLLSLLFLEFDSPNLPSLPHYALFVVAM
jgi:hypothetical protein